jgi:hypothetical protein
LCSISKETEDDVLLVMVFVFNKQWKAQKQFCLFIAPAAAVFEFLNFWEFRNFGVQSNEETIFVVVISAFCEFPS